MSLAKPTPRERAKPRAISPRCECGAPRRSHVAGLGVGMDPTYPACKRYRPGPVSLRRSPIQRASAPIKAKCATCGHVQKWHTSTGCAECPLTLGCQKFVAKAKRKTKVRKQRKTGRAALARLADKLCGQIVRMKGRCEDCGDGPGKVLQWAHGFSRRYKATRWLRINGFCLCSGCHFKYGLRPLEWDNWLRLVWGPSVYDELRRLALKNERVDLEATVASLRAELARMGTEVQA